MSITIEKKPGLIYENPLFKLNINLNDSVKSYLNKGEELTNKKSVEILKSIKWKSSLKSFLTNPIVIIPTGIALSATGLALTLLPPLFPLAFLITVIGSAILGFSLAAYWKGDLQMISKAFGDESNYAKELLQKLTQDQNIELKLKPAFLL